MIQITRTLARHWRAVLRKTFTTGRRGRVPLLLQTGGDGLRLRAVDGDVAVEYHRPGKLPADSLVFPSEALADFEGGREDAVILESVGTEGVQARWNDGGVPQVRDYVLSDNDVAPDFPALPQRWHRQDQSLLAGLRDAVATTAKENVRYSLQRVQLRGGKGQLVGTDGHQLLVQGGFTFPWKEDVLVPALGMFGLKEILSEETVALAKTDTHVGLRIGAWTFLLAIDSQGRFPNVESVIPSLTGKITTCTLDAEDISVLARAIPHLPGAADENAPVTLDLNGQAVVRARAEGQERVTEVVMPRSQISGPAVRLVSRRDLLARALALGFREIQVVSAKAPIVCRDEKRTFVWMTLENTGALAPSADAVRIGSSSNTSNVPVPRQERSTRPMPRSTTNGNGNGHVPLSAPNVEFPMRESGAAAPSANGFNGLIEEAQALRSLLRDALVRVNQLLLAAKQQKKQSHLLRTTLATLKQLQNVEA